MSDKLILKKHGLEAWKWDGSGRSDLRFKEQEDGSVIVTDRKTKQEVARYASMDEADKPYWKQRGVNGEEYCWVTELRSNLEIEEGVTVEDFIAAIKQHEDLETACVLLFGGGWDDVKFDAPVTVERWGLICDGEMTFHLQAAPDADGTGPAYLKESGVFKVLKALPTPDVDAQPFTEGEYKMSMLEIMQALFDKKDRSKVYYMQHHANDTGVGGNVTIHEETGEEVTEHLIDILLNPIELIGDSFTLNQVFKRVAMDEGLTFFMSAYSWCRSIKEFHTEADILASKEVEEPDEHWATLRRSHVCRYMEIQKHRREDTPYFSEYMDFRTYGDLSKSSIEHYDQHPEKQRPTEECYGVSFSPAYHYSHLPITIDHSVEYTKGMTFSRKGRVEPEEVLATVTCPITLLDFLDAIYWEISFNGGPEKRDDFREEMKDRVDECKENTELGKLTKYFPSYEAMFDYEFEDDEDWKAQMKTWLDACPAPLSELQREQIFDIVGCPYGGYSVDHDLDPTPDDPPCEGEPDDTTSNQSDGQSGSAAGPE
jgi:hypothetical protein